MYAIIIIMKWDLFVQVITLIWAKGVSLRRYGSTFDNPLEPYVCASDTMNRAEKNGIPLNTACTVYSLK